MELNIQFELFIYSLFIGVYLGVTYDLFYYFIFMHVHKIIKMICDMLFFVSQGFIVFHLIFKINNGIIPIYCYFLFLLGFLIYYHYSQQYYQNKILPVKKIVYSVCKRVLIVLKYLLIKPFIDSYNFFYKVVGYLILLVKKLLIKTIKKIKKKKKFLF